MFLNLKIIIKYRTLQLGDYEELSDAMRILVTFYYFEISQPKKRIKITKSGKETKRIKSSIELNESIENNA